jgi:alkylation response protein AidB-like acyl-CoA dehydrogenase
MAPAFLDHPRLASRFSAAHHDLRRRARACFAPSRCEHWLGDGRRPLAKAHWQELGGLGLIAASAPRERGGLGLGRLGSLIVSEAATQLGDLGVALGLHCQSEITARWLATAHDAGVRDRYLPDMLAGRSIGCAADTEPDGSLSARATQDGDELVVCGRKTFVINGVNADLCFVTARHQGELTTVLVEKTRPGVRVVTALDKLGTRAIDSATLDFDEVRVPLTHLSTMRGVRHLMHWNRVMTEARWLMCADACSTHASLLERMRAYAERRIVDGRPLACWPLARRALSQAIADQALMRAGLIERFEQLEANRQAAAEVAALKVFCVDRTTRFASLCAEMQGGAGYLWDSPFLSAQAQMLGLRMAGGSITAMKIIAGQALAVRDELEMPA